MNPCRMHFGKMFLLLSALSSGFSSGADEPGIWQLIRTSLPILPMRMEDSLDQLRKRPYPFDDWIARHGKRYFPKWDRQAQLRWLTELLQISDAGSTTALIEVAQENAMLLVWDLHAMQLPSKQRKRVRHALGCSITLKYWRNTLEVTPDGTYVLRLKDLRDGAECAFRARCGRIPETGKLMVVRSNSDLEVGYWIERTVRNGKEIRFESPFKVLFAVRRDAETNLWFETGSWDEVRKKNPAVTVYEEIRNVPVCFGITDGKKVFQTFRLREEARRFKQGELRSADILQSQEMKMTKR